MSSAHLPAIPLPDPPIEDDVLRLRPWKVADVPDLVAAWHDPEVARWTGVPATPDHATAERWVAGEADRRARGLCIDLVIDLRGEASTDVAGEVGLVTVPGRPCTMEIGWWVASPQRGRRLATRAAHLLAAWALDELAVGAVVARCHPDNPGSGRVAEAAGFERVVAPTAADGRTEVWQFAPARRATVGS